MYGTSTHGMRGDRVYQRIKASVIAYEYPQGKRIYLEPIAERLGVSTMPVREALNRLAAEALVIKAPRKGFIANTLSEANLKGHYSLTRFLLSHELETLAPDAIHKLSEHRPIADILSRLRQRQLGNPATLVALTSAVFNHIAALRENAGVSHLIDVANDHLYYIRTLECRHLEDVQSELTNFCELLLAGRCEALITEIDTYHDRRLALLPTLLEASWQ